MKQKHKENIVAPKSFYFKYYKLFLFLPLVIFIASVFFIAKTLNEDGTPIYRDISLKGGLSVIVLTDNKISLQEFESSLENKFPKNIFAVSEVFDKGKRTGFIVDTDVSDEDLQKHVSSIFGEKFVNGENYLSNYISSSLSLSFFKQTMIIMAVSFVLMSIVVFFYFKVFVPSVLVIMSVIFDLVATIGVLDAFGVRISIAGIGALLMLIGYSVDTDMLLTNRLIREKVNTSMSEKLFSAWSTGSIMTTTTFIAALVAMIFTNSEVIREIAIILVVGLIIDYISTWGQNMSLLVWWLESKEKKEKRN